MKDKKKTETSETTAVCIVDSCLWKRSCVNIAIVIAGKQQKKNRWRKRKKKGEWVSVRVRVRVSGEYKIKHEIHSINANFRRVFSHHYYKNSTAKSKLYTVSSLKFIFGFRLGYGLYNLLLLDSLTLLRLLKQDNDGNGHQDQMKLIATPDSSFFSFVFFFSFVAFHFRNAKYAINVQKRHLLWLW